MREKLKQNADLVAVLALAALLGFGSLNSPAVQLAANLETLAHVSISELAEPLPLCFGGF